MEPLITIAIPTRNRPNFLQQSLESVLNQAYESLRVLVIDNNSEMDMSPIINKFSDSRVSFVKNSENLGIIGNWNKAIELCRTEYLSVFHDDDIMLPQFISRSIDALENNPTVGFSYSHANKVDESLNYISLWSSLFPGEGFIKGTDYILYTIKQGCCVTIAPTVVVRKNVFDSVGKFRDNLCFNSFDFNMWLRIANKFDVYFVNEVLVNYRVHEGQMSKTYWRSHRKAKGRLATMFELQEAISLLLDRKDISTDQKRVDFLNTKLKENNKLAAHYARMLVDNL